MRRGSTIGKNNNNHLLWTQEQSDKESESDKLPVQSLTKKKKKNPMVRIKCEARMSMINFDLITYE